MTPSEIKVDSFDIDIFDTHDIIGYKVDDSGDVILKVRKKESCDPKSVFKILDGIFKPSPQINFG